MTNAKTVDKLAGYLLSERKRLIFLAASHGLNYADIARIFKVNRSVITDVFKKHMEEYKIFLISNNL